MRNLRLFAVLIPLVFLGAGCLGGGGGAAITPVTLEYWRADDDVSSMTDIIEAYQKIHPNVTINYRSIRSEDYEGTLLEALAESRGPDLFSIPNVKLREWTGKILPIPKEITIPTRVVNDKQQIVTVNQKTAGMTTLELNKAFVEVVTKDVLITIPPEQRGQPSTQAIIGLPFSADTLALFYNADLLTKADIEAPPETWYELQQQSRKLTLLDENEDIRQSGAAMGLSRNVRNHLELLSAIMMQNGAEMTTAANVVNFHKFTEATRDDQYQPGVAALIFYQNFGVKGSRDFSWDDKMPNSLDAFITGKAAFYFGFPIDRRTIAERAPKLNFGIAPLPQVDPGQVRNIAKYPVETVSKKTSHPNEAWDFLQFATGEEQVAKFLVATKRPTALRNLISSQLEDPDVGPFAEQVLTAESWYKGMDYDAAVEAFARMINTRPTIQKPDYEPIVAQGAGEVMSSYR